MTDYHRETAYKRDAMWGYALDWAHQPNQYKEYQHKQTDPLPKPRPPKSAFFDLIYGWPPQPAEPNNAFDASDLAAVCLMSAGITSRTARALDGLRAPASAGALFPSELYAVSCGVSGLDDALYHFDVQTPGLTRLWGGPLAGAAARFLGADPAKVSFFISSMFWRSLWKYRSRAYRYLLLDAGHMLGNLELALAACGCQPRVFHDFVDQSAGAFLGLASEDEVAMAAVLAGPQPNEPGPAQPGLPPLDLRAKPLSAAIGRDQNIQAAHSAGNLDKPVTASLRPASPVLAGGRKLSRPLGQTDHGQWSEGGPSLLEVARTRRSRRNFLPMALQEPLLASLLAAAFPVPAPFGISVLLGAGSEPGAGVWRYQPQDHSLLPVHQGSDPRSRLGRACLSQNWVGQAAMSVVLWADLDALTESQGPRAYRRAMLAAGRCGQRLYLAATAFGLGCCGVGAFYDDEVATAARLPENAQPLYVLSTGPVKGWPEPNN